MLLNSIKHEQARKIDRQHGLTSKSEEIILIEMESDNSLSKKFSSYVPFIPKIIEGF